jgi:hypothetical protein
MMSNIKYQKGLIFGIIVLLIGAVVIPSISGNVEIENSQQKKPLRKGFWKHPDIILYNITDSYSLFPPERTLYNTAYNYNNFSMIPSGDEGYDPWIVWIDDSSEDCGAFEFEDVTESHHSGMSLQIDTDGYIWLTHGGYADIVPFDLYKSNTPLSTEDYTGYTKLLDNYWTIIGACSPIVEVLDEKVNLFFRNWWNDDPDTEIQQLQYDKNDFNTQLINRKVIKGRWFEDWPITPSYLYGRVDPRYNIGFLTVCFKHTLGIPPGAPKFWGSFPFICIEDNGEDLVDSSNVSYNLPIDYLDADIPFDNILMDKEANTGQAIIGITPNGNYYMLVHHRAELTDYNEYLLFNDGSGWDNWADGWERNHIQSPMAIACGVTKDYVVVLYSTDKEIYVSISDDDGETWFKEETIIEEECFISGIAFAQPVFNYTDNIIRFFYGKTIYGPQYGRATAKHCFIKFDASKFTTENNIPDKPDKPIGETDGQTEIEYTYSTSTTEPDGDQIYYRWDWDDGNLSDWLGPYNPGVITNASYIWQEDGSFSIRVQSRDEYYAKSIWSDPLEVTIIKNDPPKAPIINGPTSGKAGNTYSYSFVSVDPDDDDVYYEIDWGDGQVDPWDGPHESNKKITRNHTWTFQGTFTIMVRAKDVYDAIGDYGTLTVTMPRDKSTNHMLLWRLVERFPLLQKLIQQTWFGQ